MEEWRRRWSVEELSERKKNDGDEGRKKTNRSLPSLLLTRRASRFTLDRKSRQSPVTPYLRPPVVDERPRVRGQPAHGAADVLVDSRRPFRCSRDEQRRGDALLGGEDDTLLGAHADRGRAELLVCGEGEREREREGEEVVRARKGRRQNFNWQSMASKKKFIAFLP